MYRLVLLAILGPLWTFASPIEHVVLEMRHLDRIAAEQSQYSDDPDIAKSHVMGTAIILIKSEGVQAEVIEAIESGYNFHLTTADYYIAFNSRSAEWFYLTSIGQREEINRAISYLSVYFYLTQLASWHDEDARPSLTVVPTPEAIKDINGFLKESFPELKPL